MTNSKAGPQRLYLMQLSTTDVPLGPDRALRMVLPCYLVEMGDGKRVLIDSGFPADVARSPEAPRAQNEKSVLEHLHELKLRPADIDFVICTHFDVDHCGYHDYFPQAEFIVQKEHYELAKTGHARFAAARPHWDHSALRYQLVEGDTELLAGVTLLKTSGHTTGHQSVLVRLPHSGAILLAIDAVMMQSGFTVDRKAWPNDDNQEELRASTKKLLDLVEREDVSLVVFGHDGAQWQTLRKAPGYYA
jgi:N-acyl homoserine lactone hydrolase